MTHFTQTFAPIFLAVLKIFIIAFAAGLLVRKKIISSKQVSSLSQVTVLVFLPCLMFSKITSSFNPSELRIWWAFPLICAIMITVAGCCAYVLFVKDYSKKKEMIALSSLQNAGYLPLPIGQAVYADQFDTFAVYVFLFTIGLNPLLWSIGKYLVTNQAGKIKIRHFITPPLVANIFAILLVLIKAHNYIPDMVADPIDLIGEATVPVVTFVLGATLGGISIKHMPHILDSIRMIFVRFLFVPGLTLAVIYYINLHNTMPLFADFLMIQAASAPATGMILQVQTYGGNMQRIGSVIFQSYFVCIIAIPLWVTLLRFL